MNDSYNALFKTIFSYIITGTLIAGAVACDNPSEQKSNNRYYEDSLLSTRKVYDDEGSLDCIVNYQYDSSDRLRVKEIDLPEGADIRKFYDSTGKVRVIKEDYNGDGFADRSYEHFNQETMRTDNGYFDEKDIRLDKKQ